MQLREALIQMSPSLHLQRAAHAEICKLDAEIVELRAQLALLCKTASTDSDTLDGDTAVGCSD